MNTENFDLKVNDPIIATNDLGTIGGYYQETIVDKSNIYIRFIRNLKTSTKAHFTRKASEVTKSTKEEVEKVNNH